MVLWGVPEKVLIAERVDGVPTTKSEQNRRARARTRERVLRYYGGKCSCCGEDWLDFLSLDADRVGVEGYSTKPESGYKAYQWIERNDYPSGFRVLCANCTAARLRSGSCPVDRGHAQA
jgi:hypothetical protein